LVDTGLFFPFCRYALAVFVCPLLAGVQFCCVLKLKGALQ